MVTNKIKLLAWMKDTAKRKQGKPRNANNMNFIPVHSLDDFLELRKNEEAFETFVVNFLKPAYSAKWKAKRLEKTIKKISDIATISDEAFVMLTLENNWDRWIDINNKAKNEYTPTTRGKATAFDTNVMPKYTHINRKRTDEASGKDAPVVWRGWNNEGILRFNDLCKQIKENRKQHPEMDKKVLAEIDPQDNLQRPKKRTKKAPIVAKAFVDSDDDESDADSDDSDDDDKSDS